jgi:hypothetical protein
MPFGQEQEEITIPAQDAPRVPAQTSVLAPRRVVQPTTFAGIGTWLLANSFVLILGFGIGWIASKYTSKD